jgi:serine/threonine protein kinase
VVDDPTTDTLLLVMEYVEGGTLEPKQLSSNAWVPVPEGDIWKYVREVLQVGALCPGPGGGAGGGGAGGCGFLRVGA